MGLSEAAPGGVGPDEGRAFHIPHQGELPAHLPARPYRSCVSRWNLVPLGHAGRAGTDHSRASHRRPAGERIRLRGKAFAVGTVYDRPESSEIVGGHRSPLQRLCGLNYGSCRLVLVQDFRADFLTQINLRFAVVSQVSLKLDHVKVQMIQRRTHAIKPVLRFND